MAYYNKKIKILVMILIAVSMLLLIPEAVYAGGVPAAYSWAGCGANNFRIYTSWTSLHSGDLVCQATLSDTTGATCTCSGDDLRIGTTYWIEVCLEETSGNKGSFKKNDGWWKLVGFKGTWGGTSPTAHNSPPIVDNSWDVDSDDKKIAYGTDYWEASWAGDDLSYTPHGVDKKMEINLEHDKGTGNEWMVMKVTLDNDASSDSTTYLLSDDKKGLQKQSCKLGITVAEVTWASDRELYDSDHHIVTMTGGGFALNHDYKVAYYDGDDVKIPAEVTSSSGTGALASQYDFTENSGATAGTWHSVVLDTTGSAPNNYDDAIEDPNYVIDDDFDVEESAIPEFPDIIAAIAVCMLCAVAYVVMRRRVGRGDG